MAHSSDLQLLADTVKAAYDQCSQKPGLLDSRRSAILRLPELALRHRVEGLAWEGLLQLDPSPPAEVATTLNRRSEEIARQQLMMKVCCGQLAERFVRVSVPLMFIKGLTLAALCLPRPMAKDSCDIDILVDTSNLPAAAEALRECGFRPVQPNDLAALADWHDGRKESVWIDSSRDLQLDLHTGLVDNPELLKGIGPSSPRQMVDCGDGVVLPTLADEPLYAYLCVHGASSAWFRLKWLAELDAFLVRRSPPQIVQFHRFAESLGAGHASGQALALRSRIFGRPLPSQLDEAVTGNWAVRWLTDIAERQLNELAEPTERWLGTLSIRGTQTLLGDGLGFAARELGRQFREIASRPQ